MPDTRISIDMDSLDQRIAAAVKKAIHEELGDRLTKIDETLNRLGDLHDKLHDKVEALDVSLKYTNDRIESLVKNTLPALSVHIAHITENLAHQTLQIDNHRRKWNLILHGVDGAAGEDEAATRRATIDFVKESLKVQDAEHARLAACHRLSRNANAGIIIRFCDLADRDRWLSGTRNLRGSTKKISLSPDIPPAIRPLRDELMKARSELDPTAKAKSKVKYLPHWPFVELRSEGKGPQRPKKTLSEVTASVLGIAPCFKIIENVDPVQ